jgi:hypothetical protein
MSYRITANYLIESNVILIANKEFREREGGKLHTPPRYDLCIYKSPLNLFIGFTSRV